MENDHDTPLDLENQLRAHRPEPSARLVEELLTRIEAAAVPQPRARRLSRRGMRPMIAVGFLVSMLAALSALGGAGYAKSSVVQVARSSSSAVEAVVLGRRDSGAAQKPAAVTPKGTAAKPKPAAAKPKPTAAKPKPTVAKGKTSKGKRVKVGPGGSTLVGSTAPAITSQYARTIMLCYPFETSKGVRFRTIAVPRPYVPVLTPPGRVGPCSTTG